MDREYYLGKTVVITGGTKGLGLSTAEMFARHGANVIAAYKSDHEGAEKAKEQIESQGINCQLISGDLATEEGCHSFLEQVQKHTDKIDFYIHNAAATAFKGLLEIKGHHFDKTFNLSAKSFILAVQGIAPMMSEGGHIVTVSGMDTLTVVPRHGLLAAAKAALEQLTIYFAHELAAKKIHVNCVNPGFLETDSTQKYLGKFFDKFTDYHNSLIPQKRSADLQEIANVILYLCHPQSSWVVGQVLNVDGGLSRSLLPPEFTS